MAASNNATAPTQSAWDTLKNHAASKLQNWFPEYNIDTHEPGISRIVDALAVKALLVSGYSIGHWRFDNLYAGMEHEIISELDTTDTSQIIKEHYLAMLREEFNRRVLRGRP